MTKNEMNLFDSVIENLKDGISRLTAQAQQTDRDDVLSNIHAVCLANLGLLSEGITKGLEDDDFDLGRYADLLWMYHYHTDLMHYCVNKGAFL